MIAESIALFGNLVDMLDFKSVGFKKEFKTNFAFSFRPKTKYPIVKLGDILDGINGETTKIDTNKIQETGRYPVITQEKVSWCQDIMMINQSQMCH